MLTGLLIVHSLLAVVLLGAITHQGFAAAAKRSEVRKTSFLGRFRATEASGYCNAIVVLYLAVIFVGAILYPEYRLVVRPTLQSLDLRAANGAFEIKEHFSAIGLVMLPAYWMCWRQPLTQEYAAARIWLTGILAAMAWWNFVVGELLVAIKGLFP